MTSHATPKSSPASAATYEETHVHQVYDQIAGHFSQTRYKPWPVVDSFLRSRPHGSIGLDIGCGNGKYLAVNPNIFIIASDRSCALVEIARQQSPENSTALIADTLHPPHPPNTFDFAISIAVIHHLSTPTRRIAAIRAVLDVLKLGGGEGLFFVWALEQKSSRRAWDVGDEQDVLVPWVLKSGPSTKGDQDDKNDNEVASAEKKRREQTFQRYYHLYAQGELERDIVAAGGTVQRSGYDRDNWWAVASRNQSSP